ncbi:MAG TPA: hypothetical protein VD913_02600 [bacterium]|nr:hypothetical protein [bacterium]
MDRKWMLFAALILVTGLSFTGCARKKACVCPASTTAFQPVAQAAPAAPSTAPVRNYIK